MKSNTALQESIKCQNAAQLTYYCAHILKSALLSAPVGIVRKAVPAITAKSEIIAQTAKPARAATAIVLASANTTGYGFGELYLNSPAYPAGTQIPAIPAKPASLAIIGSAAVAAVAAITEVKTPAIVALKGWEDAITIEKTSTTVTITAELPVLASVGLVGSDKTIIGEITPAALQATTWLDANASGQTVNVINDPTILTVEQLFYKYALLCDSTITDTIRAVNGMNLACKRLVVTLYAGVGFDSAAKSLQLPLITVTANAGS
jgi:hypothetical protein